MEIQDFIFIYLFNKQIIPVVNVPSAANKEASEEKKMLRKKKTKPNKPPELFILMCGIPG